AEKFITQTRARYFGPVLPHPAAQRVVRDRRGEGQASVRLPQTQGLAGGAGQDLLGIVIYGKDLVLLGQGLGETAAGEGLVGPRLVWPLRPPVIEKGRIAGYPAQSFSKWVRRTFQHGCDAGVYLVLGRRRVRGGFVSRQRAARNETTARHESAEGLAPG